jgi:hypothetical protein
MINRATLRSLFCLILFLTIKISGAYASVAVAGAVVFTEVQEYDPSKSPAGASQPAESSTSPTAGKTAAPSGETRMGKPADGTAQPPSAEQPSPADKSSETQGAPAADTSPSEPVNEEGESGTPPPSEAPVPDMTKGTVPERPAASEPQREIPVPKAPAEKKFVALRSVLQAFHDFTGDENPQALTALFESVTTPGVTQIPPVVLTDGKTPAKLSIQAPAVDKPVSSFYLKNAKLVSLNMDGAAWVVEVLPDRDVYEASVTVQSNGTTTEIPITVAPPMGTDAGSAIGPDEKEFTMFLKERGTEKAPMFDLNKDGKRDYIDDYIFTANFLVKRNITPQTKTN